MRALPLLLVNLLLAAPAAAAFPPDDVAIEVTPRAGLHAELRQTVKGHLDELVKLYQWFHAHPELSLEEQKTAAKAAAALKSAGYSVTTGVGGHGLVAVLKNGAGPTVLIRGDMDALPIEEKTGLPYAAEGGKMHACGHDVHIANLVGTGRVLADLKGRWSGTLVLIGQPAEEVGKGARMMIADGLFDRFPKPDAAIALHVSPDLPAGTVGWKPAWVNANVDSVDITVHGRGGHGARPHLAADPVVAAAAIVTSLQTVVSRRVSPRAPGVVTVGSIHGGTKHNIIPDEVKLQLTVRSYADDVRKALLDGIREVATHTCAAMRCVKPPTIAIKDEYTPAAYNHVGLAEGAARLFGGLLGAEKVRLLEASMGGEDFGRYSRALEKPGFMFRLGTVAPAKFGKDGAPEQALPGLHSPEFAPAARPTLETGMLTLSALALALLDEK